MEEEPQAQHPYPPPSWERVGDETVAQADLTSAFGSIYWDAVQDELCNLVLVFQDIKRRFPKGLGLRLDDGQRFESGFVRAFIENWDPLRACRKLEGEGKQRFFDRMYRGVMETVKENESQDSQTSDHILARALLQTIGLLDIDITYEYRPAPLPSHERLPLIEDLSLPPRHARYQSPAPQKFYRAIQCSYCRKVIRGNSYIECIQGCLDEKSINNYMHFEPRKEGDDNPHAQYRARQSPWRLCRQCCAHSGHDPTHLSRMEYERHSRDQKKFARVIDLWEDTYKQPISEWAENAVAAAIDPQLWFKAGNRHQALMLGPLVLEIGVPNSQGGVLISRREIPHLRFESTDTLIAERANLRTVETPEGPAERMQARVYAFTSKPQVRGLWEAVKVLEKNTVMAAQRVLCGGLLSGHNPAWNEVEEVMVKALLASCEAYRYNHNKSTVYNNRALRQSALEIMQKFRPVVEPEVGLYFARFAKRLLEPGMNLRYNMFSNNCQNFCDNLLAGDTSFETLYAPLTVPNSGGDSEKPSFLLSFQGIMRSQDRELSTVQIYLTFCRENSDVLDFDYRPYSTGYFSETRTFLLQIGLPGTVYAQSAADLVWDFPCDTLSLLQAHLLRPRAAYGQPQPQQFYHQKLRLLSWRDTFHVLSGAIVREFVRQAEGLAVQPLLWGVGGEYNESKQWTALSMMKDRFSKATWDGRGSGSAVQKAALLVLDLYDIVIFSPRSRPILHSSRRISFVRKSRFRKSNVGWRRADCGCGACVGHFSTGDPEMVGFRLFEVSSGKTVVAFVWTVAGQVRRVVWLVRPSTLEMVFQATVKPCVCTLCVLIFWKPIKGSVEKMLEGIRIV